MDGQRFGGGALTPKLGPGGGRSGASLLGRSILCPDFFQFFFVTKHNRKIPARGSPHPGSDPPGPESDLGDWGGLNPTCPYIELCPDHLPPPPLGVE